MAMAAKTAHTAELELRAATELDLPAIAALEQRSYPPHERWSLSEYVEDFAEPGRCYLVAASRSGLLGYVVANTEDPSMPVDITALTVSPEARRTGIGRSLLLAVLDRYPQQESSLEVRTDNSAAISLYERCGFETTGLLPDFYAPGSDAFAMKRPPRHNDSSSSAPSHTIAYT
jgi:ribosomal-protein-alanine N-acetyltransferase